MNASHFLIWCTLAIIVVAIVGVAIVPRRRRQPSSLRQEFPTEDYMRRLRLVHFLIVEAPRVRRRKP